MSYHSLYSATIQELKERLRGPLPGMPAQMKMAPPPRSSFKGVPPDAKKSATLSLLYPKEEGLHIVFMKRTEDGREHGGQISFPGGRWEESDPDFIFTALREAEEEMGIPSQEVEVLGQLSEMYIPPSNSLVFPSVGYIAYPPKFVPEEKEVAEIIEVPVRDFMDERKQGMFPVKVFDFRFDTPGYLVHDEYVIWGATAMMMAELSALIGRLKI